MFFSKFENYVSFQRTQKKMKLESISEKNKSLEKCYMGGAIHNELRQLQGEKRAGTLFLQIIRINKLFLRNYFIFPKLDKKLLIQKKQLKFYQ